MNAAPKSWGYDIWSPHGNAGYALWLYREHGIAPGPRRRDANSTSRGAAWRRPADRALACPLFAATERGFDFFEGREIFLEPINMLLHLDNR